MMSVRLRRGAAFRRVARKLDDHRYDVMYSCCQIEKEFGGVMPQDEFLSVFSPGGRDWNDHHINSGYFRTAKDCRDWEVMALCFAAAMARTGDL